MFDWLPPLPPFQGYVTHCLKPLLQISQKPGHWIPSFVSPRIKFASNEAPVILQHHTCTRNYERFCTLIHHFQPAFWKFWNNFLSLNSCPFAHCKRPTLFGALVANYHKSLISRSPSALFNWITPSPARTLYISRPWIFLLLEKMICYSLSLKPKFSFEPAYVGMIHQSKNWARISRHHDPVQCSWTDLTSNKVPHHDSLDLSTLTPGFIIVHQGLSLLCKCV